MNMINYLFVKTIILIISFTIILLAKDTFLGTLAGNIYLEEKVDSIQMIREDVHITLKEDTSHVKCTFWIANYGSSKDVTIVFDNYTIALVITNSVQNFTCKIDGLPCEDIAEVTLHTKHRKPHTPSEEKQWFKWDIHIEKNDTVKLENEYDGNWGNPMCEKSFHYTIGAGNTWAGSIGSGHITFDHSNLASTNFVIKPDKSDRLTPVYYDDSVVYSFSNYTPKQGDVLTIRIYSTSFFFDYSVLNPCLMNYIKSAENARLIRNEFLALHGFKFKDTDVLNYYSKRKWYKVNSLFDTTRFSNGEKKVIQYLIEKEKSFENK